MRKSVFILVLLILFAGCGKEPVYEEPVGYLLPWSDLSIENNERPVIMVGGELYYFDDYVGKGKIPEEYSEIGKAVPVTDNVPKKDLEIFCKDGFSGKVFAGGENNTTVYIVADGENGLCIRFACEKMVQNPNVVGHNGMISYGGKLYMINYGYGEEYFEELSAGFELSGELEYIGIDNVPQNDFETNMFYDGYGSSVNEKKVFTNPADTSMILIENTVHWAEGSYINFLCCPVFE